MEFLVYTTQEGDRWDLIAWNMYGDPTLYEDLIRYNPTVAADPILAGGVQLKIPIIEEDLSREEFTPW